MKTITVTESVWEDLTKLKLEWKNSTLSDVIVRLLDNNEISSQNPLNHEINTSENEDE